jgi:hypothetical protein
MDVIFDCCDLKDADFENFTPTYIRYRTKMDRPLIIVKSAANIEKFLDNVGATTDKRRQRLREERQSLREELLEKAIREHMKAETTEKVTF